MHISPKSYCYFALCELDDAMVNIEHLRILFKDDEILSPLLDSVFSDVNSAYDKLSNLSF